MEEEVDEEGNEIVEIRGKMCSLEKDESLCDMDEEKFKLTKSGT